MNALEQKAAAQRFVDYWLKQPGTEEEQSRSFWIQLLEEVLDVPNSTHLLDFERKVRGRKIDVFYEDMGILVEQKGRGISLDEATIRSKKIGPETPYQQASWYAQNLPYSIRPRFIITCNFDKFRIYDQEQDNPNDYVEFDLTELPSKVYLLNFFTDTANSRLEIEKQLSVEAGRIVARLYDELSSQYKNLDTDPHEQYSLNVLIVRLVFLFYAEDSGLLHKKDAFLNYLKHYQAPELRSALIDLFKTLNTPDGSTHTQDQRDAYAPEILNTFPYINGGLFSDETIVIPQFTDQTRDEIINHASQSFDWSGISPTIFGAVFESTLNSETRRSGGMHYTSIENIHKIIDPLFLNDLQDELSAIEGEKVERKRKIMLQAFQDKLASLSFLDPACGSGNFLTEAYLSLRKLENRVLENLFGDNATLGFTESELNPIKVQISQFYGIEINDFALSVAKTALWIAEQQMMQATEEITHQFYDFLPLKSLPNIIEGNALRVDWNDILPPSQCSYIMGNPPFIGYSNHTKAQGEDRALYFGKVKTVDYVACWYVKASDYMEANKNISSAFVSTNSICQGQQVEPIWRPLFDKGVHINFAYQSFIWNNEATDQAHVHCVIVGFSYKDMKNSLLFGKNEKAETVNNINGYLTPARNVFITKQTKPLCSIEPMIRGCQPTDGGNLLLTPDDKDALLRIDPSIEQWIKPFSMGAEFIKGQDRFCLWLKDASSKDLEDMSAISERIANVRELRLASTKAATRKKADTPWLFDEIRPPKTNTYIGIPSVSSERRQYIPIGFVDNGMIPGNKLYFVSTEQIFVFGILTSQFHNAWMRAVAGRLEMRYNYANTIVYNNFIWPGVTKENIDIPVENAVAPEVRGKIEQCAQAVLDARANHDGKSLADLYDPDKMPKNLFDAHKALDRAVEEAYGVNFGGDEEKIVAHLFKLYAELTGGA